MRILISGGHLTPALALIDYIKKEDPSSEIYFAGRKYSKRDDKQLSREKQETEKRGVKFVTFSSGKLGVGNFIEKSKNFIELVAATFRAILIIPKYKPDIFVSFGGYLAVPLAIAAWLWRIPIITHEQTRTAGIANLLIAKIANKVALAYPDTAGNFPKNKTVVTGNPIREAVLVKSNKQPEWYTTASKRPILYVTGGSQGSEVINTTVSRSLATILKDWIVIHQCGAPTKKRKYTDDLEKASKKVSKRKQGRYFIRPWVKEDDLAWIYTHATAMVARSGANTTAEITARNIPSILIPLPFSHNDEQLLNAKALSEKGAAILLHQKRLDPKSLTAALDTLAKQPKSYQRKLQNIETSHKEAPKKIYNLIQQTVSQ